MPAHACTPMSLALTLGRPADPLPASSFQIGPEPGPADPTASLASHPSALPTPPTAGQPSGSDRNVHSPKVTRVRFHEQGWVKPDER
jgi:hypothetical protein